MFVIHIYNLQQLRTYTDVINTAGTPPTPPPPPPPPPPPLEDVGSLQPHIMLLTPNDSLDQPLVIYCEK